MKKLVLTTKLMLTLVAGVALAQESAGEPGRDSDGPNPLKNVYFGEQHIHTRNSPDAFVLNERGTWADVYNYAMGKEIKLSTTGEKMPNEPTWFESAMLLRSSALAAFGSKKTT